MSKTGLELFTDRADGRDIIFKVLLLGEAAGAGACGLVGT